MFKVAWNIFETVNEDQILWYSEKCLGFKQLKSGISYKLFHAQINF